MENPRLHLHLLLSSQRLAAEIKKIRTQWESQVDSKEREKVTCNPKCWVSLESQIHPEAQDMQS